MANHLTPEELAKEMGMDRDEVVRICIEEGVPIYHGKIDKTLFQASLEAVGAGAGIRARLKLDRLSPRSPSADLDRGAALARRSRREARPAVGRRRASSGLGHGQPDRPARRFVPGAHRGRRRARGGDERLRALGRAPVRASRRHRDRLGGAPRRPRRDRGTARI